MNEPLILKGMNENIDKIHADRIRECIKNLEYAVAEARKAKLIIKIDIQFSELYSNLKIYRQF